MKAREIKPNVYWVGAVDWNLRNFHGYSTDKGSSYNAYLIIDEKITLVDTVKYHLVDEMIERIKSVIDPAKIDYVISNHVEMDHSGGLPAIMKLLSSKSTTLFTSVNGEKGLKNHYHSNSTNNCSNWNFKKVVAGDSISLGKYTVKFIPTPMVHWPDSMISYIPELKLLLPNDAFGQHIASASLYEDEVGWDIVKMEAAKYYANIVLPYGKNVQSVLKSVSEQNLAIDMIAPSHGVILRTNTSIEKMIHLYQKWSSYTADDNKAVIVYDTMWGSTEKMAHAIKSFFEEKMVATKMISLSHTHISDAMTDIMEAKYVLIGSPTLNNTIMPTVGALLTYMKGLRPTKKIGFAFGSFGWSGQSVKHIEEALRELEFEMPVAATASAAASIKYIPTNDDLENLKRSLHSLVR
ncbi:MAG: FprA family A-type flavoprotein [Oligoflexia bacterium]|nr:FprA family A-type flavoprotein [Oligoflexia bacterium]